MPQTLLKIIIDYIVACEYLFHPVTLCSFVRLVPLFIFNKQAPSSPLMRLYEKHFELAEHLSDFHVKEISILRINSLFSI